MRKIVWKGHSLGGLTELRVSAFGDVERKSTYHGWTIDGVCGADAVYALRKAVAAITLQCGSAIEYVE